MLVFFLFKTSLVLVKLLQRFRRYSYVRSSTSNKKGMVIFGLFAEESDFGTCPKLFLEAILAYNS